MLNQIVTTAQRYLKYTRMAGSDHINGPCPFHKGGEERHPSFYMSVSKGLFYCHACHARGTFVQFLRLMGLGRTEIDDLTKDLKFESAAERRDRIYRVGITDEEFQLNEALLGVFQYCPTDLIRSGFDKRLLQKLEIGFDRERQRIVYPIRNLYGTLVGLSGRTVVGEHPRYQVYKGEHLLQYAPDDPLTRARYERYKVQNHNHLWNLHNIYPQLFFGEELRELIIVEGYKACMWLLQQGFSNVVALQGSRMTWVQERLLHRFDAHYILFLDNNKAGISGMIDTGTRLMKLGHPVSVCRYPSWCEEEMQPDNFTADELLEVLSSTTPFQTWRTQCSTILPEMD